jgi:hypothetical protein
MGSGSQLAAGALALALALPASAAALLMQRTELPRPRTEGAVTWVSGGLGRTESAAMTAEAKDYPLRLFFSIENTVEYLADVHVTIKDHTGTDVLSTTAEGPIMLVKLPPGEYTVVADAFGKDLRETVTVGAKGGEQLSFHWPNA